MDKVIEIANKLSDEIKQRPEVIEYLKYKGLMENSEELQGFRKEIAKLTASNNLKERDELLAKYNTHPIVANYENYREEVIELLNSIKEIIN